MKTHALLLPLLLIACAAHGQPKPANQITRQDLQLAMEQQMHVADAALIDTCSAEFPNLAKPLAVKWNAALKDLPPQLLDYRKTPQFAKALGELTKEQRVEAKKPENKEALRTMCSAVAQ